MTMEYPEEITRVPDNAPILKTAFRIGAGTALQQAIRRTEAHMTPIEFLRMLEKVSDEVSAMG